MTIGLDETAEQDIIQRLASVPNKDEYIKALIRADIERETRSYSSMTKKQQQAYDRFKALSQSKPSE